MDATRIVAVCVLTLVLPGAALCEEPPPTYKGKPLPELAVEEGQWFNADKAPTIASLRGKLGLVVLTTLW